MEKEGKSLPHIGRTAKADIPEWDIYGIDAKIDTGAYTSSLHCHHIAPTIDDKVQFKLLDPSHPAYNQKLMELPIYKVKTVKSSNGKSEDRFIIKASIVLDGKKLNAQFSLTDRSTMRYPLLIGRRLLKDRFLVDVSKD